MAEVLAEAEENLEKGKTIFLDVFRRADKKDDGTLSWAEFQSFFSDGIISTEDLQKLFNEIDTHNTNNLDTAELCEFFLKEAGPFSQVFAGLEEMNKAITTALLESSKEYPNQSISGKFITRFLLKEVLGQLALLDHHVDVAVDKIDENEARSDSVVPAEAPFGGRIRRKQQANFAQQTSVDASGLKNILCQEVDRLSDLITKLENKAKFNIVDEVEEGSINEKAVVIIVARKFSVSEKFLESFTSNLTSYIGATSLQDGIIKMSLRKYPNECSIVLYEVWASSDDLNRHYCSQTSKTFLHNNIDYLKQPEDYSKMSVPASWWVGGTEDYQ